MEKKNGKSGKKPLPDTACLYFRVEAEVLESLGSLRVEGVQNSIGMEILEYTGSQDPPTQTTFIVTRKKGDSGLQFLQRRNKQDQEWKNPLCASMRSEYKIDEWEPVSNRKEFEDNDCIINVGKIWFVPEPPTSHSVINTPADWMLHYYTIQSCKKKKDSQIFNDRCEISRWGHKTNLKQILRLPTGEEAFEILEKVGNIPFHKLAAMFK